MKMRVALGAGIFAALHTFCSLGNAQLPADFPLISVQPNINPAPGYLFGSLSVSNVPGYSNYFAILDNTGTNAILLNKTNSLGLLGCNGLFVSREGGKGSVVYLSKDSSFNLIATNLAGNGYIADNRDMHVLPNGHGVITIQDSVTLDLSTMVPGGNPAAKISHNIIQEIDVDNNVVFQWRILDHVPITDSYQDLTNPGSYAHVNSVWFDDLDGSIIISCRNTSQILKINRVTGEIIWRLGGKQNEFTFTNAIPEGMPGYGEPAQFAVQHSAKRLPNGNITVFDNGYSDHSDPQWHFDRPYSRAVEYEIDEIHKTAKLVWQYRHTPDIITYNGGDVLRLPSGHTIITWGNDNNASPRLAMSEADEMGNPVCDVTLLQTGVTGNFTRMLWPLENQYLAVTKRELSDGNSYTFSEGSTNTGVTIYVETLEGDQYNSLSVTRQPFAPVLPRFLTKAPRVLPVRLTMTQNLIDRVTGQISFDANSFGLKDPTNTTVYYRETPGQGLFVPLPTEYNWVTQQLQTSLNGSGEYIFGFPDLAEVPYPPLLITPAAGATVNQTLPVSFFWTPKGFGEGYHLQVSTDPGFGTLVADVSDLTETRYTLASVAPNTQYFWRVNTANYGGLSDWATNSFTAVPPMVQVTAPNGGEAWQRGQFYYVQWKGNIGGSVALDVYKAGVLVRTITTNAASNLAYRWQVNLTLVPGSDYAFNVRSATNSSLSDMSDAPFSIVDAPVISGNPTSVLPDGRRQFGFTAPGAAQATVWGAAILPPPSWQNLGPVPVTGGTGTFTTTSPYLFYRVSLP